MGHLVYRRYSSWGDGAGFGSPSTGWLRRLWNWLVGR
jgi:hypothetical protein